MKISKTGAAAIADAVAIPRFGFRAFTRASPVTHRGGARAAQLDSSNV